MRKVEVRYDLPSQDQPGNYERQTALLTVQGEVPQNGDLLRFGDLQVEVGRREFVYNEELTLLLDLILHCGTARRLEE